MEQNKDQSGAAVRGEAVAASEPTDMHPAWSRVILYTDSIRGKQTCRDDLWAITGDELRALLAARLSARAADAPSEPSEVALWDDNGEPMNDAAEKEWRQCNERIRQRAADALDSQPLIRPQPNHPGRWLRGDDGISYPSEQVASSQPTDGGVRNG